MIRPGTRVMRCLVGPVPLAARMGTLVRPLGLVAALTLLAANGLRGQEPAPGPGDADSTVVELAEVDSLELSPPVQVRPLPEEPRASPAGYALGVWQWGPEDLLSTRALTLRELLQEIPGVTTLRGGDYGQPESAAVFGSGGGRLRIFLDGIEMPPLDGAVVDLSRVGLGGFESVRVVRRPTGLRVDLTSLAPQDPRPRTLIEVGTGELNTNFFRGTFVHPTLLGGSLALTLDRIDTSGPFGDEPGGSWGGSARYAHAFGERVGVSGDFRRRSSRRPDGLWDSPVVKRTEMGLRGHLLITSGLVGTAYVQRSYLEPGADAPATFEEEAQIRAGLRLTGEARGWWARVEADFGRGRGVASSGQRLSASGVIGDKVGMSVDIERESWDGEARWEEHARVWTLPWRGISLFGEIDDSDRPVPSAYLEDDGTPVSWSERTGTRVGSEWSAGDLFVGAAVLRVRADSIHPHALPSDRGGLVLGGGERTGWEISTSVPLRLVLPGLRLVGEAVFWNPDVAWSYLPERSYNAKLSFHDVFLESGNLEVWADLGAEGRDPMLLPAESGSPALAAVPFFQSWYGFLQIRVVSGRLFIRWENLTLRPRNQDYPDRLLPQSRVMYGVRWELWN